MTRPTASNSRVYLCICVCRREEKLKRAERRQKHASVASETASDRSRTDRDSSELKPSSLTLPLAAAPERGILKKGSSQGSISGVKSSRPLLTTASPTCEDVELVTASAAAAVCNALNSDAFEFIDGVDDDDDMCSCCCDEDMEAVSRPSETAVDCEAGSAGVGGCSVETQTDPESLASSLTSVCDASDKMTRLCNINELLRQIDEQFNSVLHATSMSLDTQLSPTNSDDVRGSETEADRDRACPLQVHPSDPAVRPCGLSGVSAPSRGLPSVGATDRLLSRAACSSASPATITSEGYHSDRIPPTDSELPIIIREIPKSSAVSVQCLSDHNMRPPSNHLHSLDDVDI